jgi:capsular exopolysaccharide synthesis family protein
MIFQEVQSQTNFQIYQRTQLALVKSRLVLVAALRQPEVRQLSLIRELEKRGPDEALDWLERGLKVDFSVGPEILQIALEGEKSEELKALVSAVEDAYLEEIVKKDRRDAEKRLVEMAKWAQKYDEDVKRKRKWLADISKPLGTNDPATMAEIRKLNQQYLNRTEMELIDVRSELRKLEEEEAVGLAVGKEIPEVAVSDFAIDEYLKNDPDARAIQVRRQKIETQIREAQGVLVGGDKSEIVQRYKKDLQAAEAELAALRNELRPRLAKDLLQKARMEQGTGQVRLKQRIALLRSWESRLDKEVNRLRKEIEDIGKSTLDIDSYKAEITQAEELAKKFAHQVEALTVEKNAPVRIKHLQDAYVTRPDEQKRKLVAAGISGTGALALVLFLIAWWQSRRQRVNSVDEVTHGLGMELMGTVPALPSRRQLQISSSSAKPDIRWQNILTESVDTARTMLLHKARSESLRTIMVTSAAGGEGKTSLSSHLAASLARAGRKTLLVDADLRNPAIHRLFVQERSPGLSDLLRGEVELAETIQATPAPGLYLIPAGRCDGLALQALAQDGFRNIIEPLRADFDFIVVDSAPVLPVADSLLIGQFVDGVIFSILYDVSRLPKVYAAHQRLEMLGIRMLGAVVSGARVEDYGPDYEYLTEAHR